MLIAVGLGSLFLLMGMIFPGLFVIMALFFGVLMTFLLMIMALFRLGTLDLDSDIFSIRVYTVPMGTRISIVQ